MRDPSENRKNINKSGLVKSAQTGVHPHLEKHLRRHLETPWLQPFHQPTLKTYRQLKNAGVLSAGQPFVLDSGCGTGESTRWLAGMFPAHMVIGVDRSHVRLAKSLHTTGGAALLSNKQSKWTPGQARGDDTPVIPGLTRKPFLFDKSCISSNVHHIENYVLVRAELATFWRLLSADGYSPEKHFLLYPNPWPKAGHLSRRWHGHPVFPQLLRLGGEIEMRCNWEIYAQEFAQAVTFVTGKNVNVEIFRSQNAISPFEQKYLERGHTLFSVKVPG